MSSFRITTNGMFRNYRTNLYKNNQKLQSAMTGVETERKFTAYAEDPAAASKAWRLRRNYWLTGDQIDNTNYAISKYESASQAMHSIVDGDAGNGIYGLTGILSAIKGINGTAGASRTALGKEMVQTAQNMVSVMNGKYGDDFVFAGADGKNVPFSWDENNRLLYRGISVDLEKPTELSEFGLTEEDLGGLTPAQLSMTEPVAPTEPTAPTFSLTPPTPPAMPEYPAGTALLTQDEYDAALADYNKALDEYYYPFQTPEAKAGMSDEQKTLYQFAEGVLNYANEKGDYDKAYGEYKSYVDEYNTAMEKFTAAKKQYDEVDKPAYDAIKDQLDAIDALKSSGDINDQIKYDKIQKFREYAVQYEAENGVPYAEAQEQYEKLDKMANEATYIDIGIGMKEDKDGSLITGSAFNTAVSGLKFLGYGKDQNLAMVVRELGEIFLRSDPETGEYASEEDNARADELLTNLHDAVGAAQSQHVQLEADAKYLNTNLDQLKLNKNQLNTQINDTERMDMAEAITEMSWAQYCYNAALRIGTNILSQSLIDYMS